jgi:hypothetical protein
MNLVQEELEKEGVKGYKQMMQEQVDAHNFIKNKNRQLWRNYETEPAHRLYCTVYIPQL